MTASIISAVVGLLAFIGAVFGVYTTGKKAQRGEQAKANLDAAKKAQEARNETAGKSDADLDRDLGKWVRPSDK